MTALAGKPCLQCGGPITSRGPKRDAKVMYCSRACAREAEHQRNAAAGTAPITKACEICRTPFTYYASVRPQAAYCSTSCKSKGHARVLTGRIQPRFADRATFTKSMRRFLEPRCAICGWDEAPCDVAHIVARKAGGEDALENVTMLCPNHHRMYDLGLIPEDRIREGRAAILRHA